MPAANAISNMSHSTGWVACSDLRPEVAHHQRDQHQHRPGRPAPRVGRRVAVVHAIVVEGSDQRSHRRLGACNVALRHAFRRCRFLARDAARQPGLQKGRQPELAGRLPDRHRREDRDGRLASPQHLRADYDGQQDQPNAVARDVGRRHDQQKRRGKQRQPADEIQRRQHMAGERARERDRGRAPR